MYAAGISFWLVPTVRGYFDRSLVFSVLFQIGFWLATVGIYGVISYSVVQRTGEIGLRMALGADAPRTFRLVVGQTLGFVLAGALIGVAATMGKMMCLKLQVMKYRRSA